MPGRDETVDNGVHYIAMRREQFTAGRGNLDADLVVRRNERAPGAGEIGLAGRGEDEAVYHSANDGGIGVVVLDGGRIPRRIHDGLRGNHLRAGTRSSAEQKRG